MQAGELRVRRYKGIPGKGDISGGRDTVLSESANMAESELLAECV